MRRLLLGLTILPAACLLFSMVFLQGCATRSDPRGYIEALSETDPPCAIKLFENNEKRGTTRIECDR